MQLAGAKLTRDFFELVHNFGSCFCLFTYVLGASMLIISEHYSTANSSISASAINAMIGCCDQRLLSLQCVKDGWLVTHLVTQKN